MTKFGIMQGRLVPPEPGRLQAFPRRRWADEFAFAAAVPLSYIEWIYDAYGEDVNPLRTEDRIEELLRLQQATGVAIRSLCADWFMDFPLLRCTEEQRTERQNFLAELLQRAQKIGVNRIVLPFVDASSIETIEDTETVGRTLEAVLPQAEATGVELHLETSLGPAAFAKLLARLPHPMVKVNYDTGNSAALGYQASEEFAHYGLRIGSVHIKDRVLGGGTVSLGTGNVDFDDVFDGLKELNYSGDFTMQIARGESGGEVGWAKGNMAFIRRYWPN